MPLSDSLKNKYIGIPIFIIRHHELSQRVMREYPTAASVSLEKKYPSTLRVGIKEKKPLVALKVDEAFYFLADDTTLLSKHSSASAIPVLSTYHDITDSYRKGMKLPYSDLRYALQLAQALKNENVRSISIVNPQVIQINFFGEPTLYVVSKEKRVAKNALLMHNIRIELAKQKVGASKVDLRFDKPVVVP